MAEHAQTPNESEQTVVYSGKGSMSLKKKLIIGLIVLVGVFGATIGLLWWQQQSQPAFVINGKEYSRDHYNQMMVSAEAAGVSKKDATEKYIDVEKRRIAAEQLEIEPTPTDTQVAKANIDLPKNDQTNLYVDLLAYDSALEPAVDFLKTPGKKGAIFYFNFSKLRETLPPGVNDPPEGYRDTKAISEAKAYAKEQAEQYRKRIVSGEKVEDIISELNANERLGRLGTSNGSTIFKINNAGEDNLGSGIVQRYSNEFNPDLLNDLKEGEVSKIKAGKVYIPDLPGSPTVEGNYYFVKLIKVSEGDSNIGNTFVSTANSLKVEKNV